MKSSFTNCLLRALRCVTQSKHTAFQQYRFCYFPLKNNARAGLGVCAEAHRHRAHNTGTSFPCFRSGGSSDMVYPGTHPLSVPDAHEMVSKAVNWLLGH